MNDLSATARPQDATPQSLRDRVTTTIRARILSGELAPGERLIERAIGAELGVSRVPVRDALNVLKGEGYVTAEPRRGMVVTELSAEDISELFDVREALEVLAVRLATERGTDAEVAELRETVRRAGAAIEEGDRVGTDSNNQAFHDLINVMAHNTVLAALIEPLEGRLHWLLLQHDDPWELHLEHLRLAQAIASRDPERAAAEAAAHVRTSRSICLAVVAARRRAR